MPNKQKLNSNASQIFMLAVGVAALYLIWKLSSFIILLVVALTLVATLFPTVSWLNQRFNKRFSAAIVVVTLVIPIIVALVMMVPVFISQISSIISSSSRVISDYPILTQLSQKIDVSQYTKNVGEYLFTSTKLFTNFITQAIILVFMVYYLLADYPELSKLLAFFIPKNYRARTTKALGALSQISGQYIRSNLFISLICFVIIFIGLWLMKVPGAITLAIFAAIMDLLPLIGATMGAIPAAILAFTVSPLTGFLTIGLFWLYQEFENNIIIPRVYSKSLKIIPFVSFVSVIIGTLLFGIAGAFLALPVAASIPTLVELFIKRKWSE